MAVRTVLEDAVQRMRDGAGRALGHAGRRGFHVAFCGIDRVTEQALPGLKSQVTGGDTKVTRWLAVAERAPRITHGYRVRDQHAYRRVVARRARAETELAMSHRDAQQAGVMALNAVLGVLCWRMRIIRGGHGTDAGSHRCRGTGEQYDGGHEQRREYYDQCRHDAMVHKRPLTPCRSARCGFGPQARLCPAIHLPSRP